MFPSTVPIVRILVANLSQDFVDSSIPALNAFKKPSALSLSTSNRVRTLFGILRNTVLKVVTSALANAESTE